MLGVSPDQSVVFAVVGVPTSANIADGPYQGVPEQKVDQKIAAKGDRSPESGIAPQESPWRVEGGDQVGSRGGEGVGDSAPLRTVREIDSRLPQKDRRSRSQDKGPNNLRFKHIGTVN